MRASTILVLAVAILVLFGLVMLESTSGPQGEKLFGNPNYFIQRQLAWLAVGLAAAVFGAWLDYHLWQKFAWLIFGAALVLLVLVYIPHVGLNIKGSHRWLRLPGGFSFQPSELAKFAAINILAFWYGARRRERGGFVGGILIPGALLVGLLGLILFEPDFGATALIGGTCAVLMLVGGAPLIWLGAGVGAGVALLAAMILRNPERVGRLLAFWNPEKYAQDEAFQLMNALYAFVAGGAWGVGLGEGLQKRNYLPEAHTDFIFAIIGEELGLIATLGVVTLFVVFMLCGLRISGRAADAGGRLMAFGITTVITLQAAINIAVVTGRLPTKGLPLPFISFGGTSLLVTLFMVGVLLNIARQGAHLPRRRS